MTFFKHLNQTNKYAFRCYIMILTARHLNQCTGNSFSPSYISIVILTVKTLHKVMMFVYKYTEMMSSFGR